MLKIWVPRRDKPKPHADDCAARRMYLHPGDHCPGCHCTCGKSNHFPFRCRAKGCSCRSKKARRDGRRG